MIKPDEIELLNDTDRKQIGLLEKLIDAGLKETRGAFQINMNPGPHFELQKVDQRVWAEVVRIYEKAGWKVVIP